MTSILVGLSVDSVIAINSEVIGMDIVTVRSSVKLGLLESALLAPFAGFGDVDVYTTDAKRIGVLGSRLVLNHAFLDGNKRTAFISMLALAHDNGIALHFDDSDDVADKFEAIASGSVDEAALCDWVGTVVDE